MDNFESKIFTRRALIAGGASAALLAPLGARADVVCRPVAPGVQACTAGIPTFRIAQTAMGTRQQMQNWCWAACIQAIFRHYGYSVSQPAIVQRVFGQAIDTTATGEQIFYAISGNWRDANGRNFSAGADVLIDRSIGLLRPDAAQIAIAEMIGERPLIVGSQGHATVVTAISYHEDAWGRVSINDVTVRDPWPLSPSRRSLSLSEFLNTIFLARVTVS